VVGAVVVSVDLAAEADLPAAAEALAVSAGAVISAEAAQASVGNRLVPVKIMRSTREPYLRRRSEWERQH